MGKILFVNHSGEKCGVYQYGINIYNAINQLKDFSFPYVECKNVNELIHSINLHCPKAVIYNYHTATMSFVGESYFKQITHPIHICLAHELQQKEIDKIDGSFFNYYIFSDPTFIEKNPLVFKMGRLLLPYENRFPEPQVPTIGSYGFGVNHKGYQMLIKIVEKEFDSAIIRINITPHATFDQQGYKMRKSAKQLALLIKNPNIKLDITHHFFSQGQLLDFLAMNSINVLMYDSLDPASLKGGISSAVDQAIAVKRPIAITNSALLRHLFSINPSILVKHTDVYPWHRIPRRIVESCIQGNVIKYVAQLMQTISSYPSFQFNSLKSILANGTSPIQNLYSEWSIEKFQKDFTRILHSIFISDQKKAHK